MNGRLAIPHFGIDTHMIEIECSAFTVTAVASTMAKFLLTLCEIPALTAPQTAHAQMRAQPMSA
jgi:hypothetical protein